MYHLKCGPVLKIPLMLFTGSFFNFRIWWLALAWLLEETVRYGILFWVPLLLDGILTGNFNGKSAVTSLREPPLTPLMPEHHTVPPVLRAGTQMVPIS